ncbi:GntR family transcriptional regulator [Chachezhania antarctica]|uniref:GntR family transcriptional regulator n=1 Tax=Chachezhania antarctica TaxID=2340860 RepID=UPI000EB37881|nr:GntR family transcriptional regulator [Chachezhania antarctica]|tara:strand:+ start:14991 stop:15686 length:696 start_codon:yes stop_codon:yes gene_type:complete
MSTDKKPAAAARNVSSSHRAHAQLREQLLRSKFLPGQKINEVALAGQLEISRTPLREALNRLVAEGLLLDRERGFSVPGLEPEVVFDLFEARVEIECATVRLACERADAAGLEALSAFLDESMAESPDASVDRLIELDIRFHDTIAELSGNKVLRQMLSNLNDRIHLVRWIAMEGQRDRTQSQHRKILDHICAADTDAAIAAMRAHILHRKEDILVAIKAAYGHVYTLASA